MNNKSYVIFSSAQVQFDVTVFMFKTSRKDFAVVWVMLGHN